MRQCVAFLLICSLLLCSCSPKSCLLEPNICYDPPEHLIANLPSAFEKLSPEEKNAEWGREMVIADRFARELDLYRAITTYKRAQFLLPEDYIKRQMQIEYSIIQCYYLGKKYCEMIEIFEMSPLVQVPGNFPAMGELLLMLYDAYQQLGREEKACSILSLIEKHHQSTANSLKLGRAIQEGDIPTVSVLAETHPSTETIDQFLGNYNMCAKSPKTAQTLNALLPGAGFYYVGQKKSAVTSFVINTLFIATAYYFFRNDNIPAGLITTSLEAGWYIGGINGAGLAAKEYNEWIYSNCGKELMYETRLFPVLMFRTAF